MSRNTENMKEPKYEVPLWHKSNLIIEEAAAYTGIGIGKLYEMTSSEGCPFVLWIGTRRLIKRKTFDDYIAKIIFDLGGSQMEDELLRYRQQLKQKLSEKPIWEKECLTMEEAAEYTGIGRTKLRTLVNQKKCPFIIPIGNQLFIVREKLEKYLKDKTKI